MSGASAAAQAATFSFDGSIFRQYDIRGLVASNFTPAVVRQIGYAFAVTRVAGAKRIVLGYDGRTHSPALAQAFSEGARAAGATIINVGLVPTPAVYYSHYAIESEAAVMITGSHNPPEYNGMKITLGRKPFYGDDITQLQADASRLVVPATIGGSEQSQEMLATYVAALLERVKINPDKPLKLAWDAGNGAAGEAMTLLTSQLPGEHILLFADIDGTFPNHHPDPTEPHNLEQLIEVVREQGCDAGIAFDGDGDRIGVVANDGTIVWGDQLVILYAEQILRDQPKATIIADVKASQVLFDEIARMGGTPLMWKTGHSLIKAKMAETKAPLAGEMSGHIFFADRYYGFDDALYAAVRFMEYLGTLGTPLSERLALLPKAINTPELRFPCDESKKFGVIPQLKALLPADVNVSLVDGLRVSTADGWWLLRASNTQDVLVARCEASTPAGLQRLKDELAGYLQQVGISPAALQ